MSNFNHSPERDEEIFNMTTALEEILKDKHSPEPDLLVVCETLIECAAIAKKWRAKALMRAVRIEELEMELDELREEIEDYIVESLDKE